MAGLKIIDFPVQLSSLLYDFITTAPLSMLFLLLVSGLSLAGLLLYLAVFILAPTPRHPLPSEKSYITTQPSGKISSPQPLPDWHASWLAHRTAMQEKGDFSETTVGYIEAPTLAMSVVIPAYNEEQRLVEMLDEAVDYLDDAFGRPVTALSEKNANAATTTATSTDSLYPKKTGANERSRSRSANRRKRTPKNAQGLSGYEIILVNDGSRDSTVSVALKFAQEKGLHDVLRIVTLQENRGKGGAVTHGFRHVRGAYAVFADADGASRFSDLGKMVDGCDRVSDGAGRGVAVGSRAHLVGSEAVVKGGDEIYDWCDDVDDEDDETDGSVQRSALRNALMHSFHMLLKILTPPATSRIRDTQCGFKLFSRAALPHIVPYMHAEGWIFDVEMLMLAESAPASVVLDEEGNEVGMSPGIRVAEVPIGWKEVGGSKLNVVWDSIGMAVGLGILRLSWMLGVYRKR